MKILRRSSTVDVVCIPDQNPVIPRWAVDHVGGRSGVGEPSIEGRGKRQSTALIYQRCPLTGPDAGFVAADAHAMDRVLDKSGPAQRACGHTL